MIINHGVRGSIPTSGPFTVKYGGSTPCVEILTKNVQIIFDCGSGFSKVKINDTIPTIILLSHFHHDHLVDIFTTNHSYIRLYSFYGCTSR